MSSLAWIGLAVAAVVVGLGMAFLIAAWGKYSSSQTFLAPNRPAWTDEQRKQEALALLNKGL